MLRIYFNTPVPHNQRDNVIRAFKSLGFKFERVIQNGEHSIIRFYGRFPTCRSPSNVDIKIDDCALSVIKDSFDFDLCEITFKFERK